LSDCHLRALNTKRRKIVDNMDPDFGLINEMVSTEIFTTPDKEYAEARQTKKKRNQFILDTIMRKSEKDFNGFLQALVTTEQAHVAKCINEGLVVPIDVTAVNSGNAPQQSTLIVETESEITQEICKQTRNPYSDLSAICADSGIPNPNLLRNCIKLLFNLQTRDSLDKLLHLIKSDELEATLTATCSEVLARHGLKKIKLNVDERYVDACRRQFDQCELMTAVHRQTLKTALDDLCRMKVNVDKELLRHLTSLDDQRRQCILSSKSDAERVEVLLEMVSRRPDSAFDELVNALRATGQNKAADVLQRAGFQEDDTFRGDRRKHSGETTSGVVSRDEQVPPKRDLPENSKRYEIYNRTQNLQSFLPPDSRKYKYIYKSHSLIKIF